MKSILFLCVFLTIFEISAQAEKKKLVNKKAIYQLYRLELSICRKGAIRKGNIAILNLYENSDRGSSRLELKSKNCKDYDDRYFDLSNSLDDESGLHPFLYISSKEYKDSFFRVYYKPLKKYFWLHKDDVKVFAIEELLESSCIFPLVTLPLYEYPDGKVIHENMIKIDINSDMKSFLNRPAYVTELKKIKGWIWVKIRIDINDGNYKIGPSIEGWIMPFDKDTGKPLYTYNYKGGC